MSYLAEIGTRLAREIPSGHAAHFPVNAVLAGRRNNPPDLKAGIPPLAVYNPIHYQELPELFMDFICSLTGKSPSTTGFGSEGALTKGPFNALPPVIDVNNALVSAIVTGYAGFTTAAGHIGPKYRVDHDNSMLVPEIWCRMRVFEREPRFLIENGYLEKVEDFEFEGRYCSGQPPGLSHHDCPSSITFSAASSKCRARSFPRNSCGPRSRIWRFSSPASTPSSKRSATSLSIILKTAAWMPPARPSKRCCTSWRTEPTRVCAKNLQNSEPCLCVKRSSRAIGIRSACAPSRATISPFGRGT